MRAEEALNRDARRAAAVRLVAIQQRYADAGRSVAHAALAGARRFERLRHYPRDDVIDRPGGAQFYYHAHDSRRRPDDEHGHFHLFARTGDGPAFHHLVALSLDARGWPIRWFTTNRWVTGEDWVDAATASTLLADWSPRTRGRLAPVADWLGAMVRLDHEPIAALLRRRDAVIARRAARAGVEPVFEDRRLDVVSQARVRLPDRLAALA